MRKQPKKLMLAKETVQNLEGSNLALLKGGASLQPYTCGSGAIPCFYSQQFTCTC